jgi:uncharacterized integral membrane protein
MNTENMPARDGLNSTNAASGRGGPPVALIAGAVIAALGAIFFLQNGELTSVDFLIFEKKTTIRWSILMAFVFGAVCSQLFGMWWRRRAKRDNKK